MEFLGQISLNENIMDADIKGIPSYESSPQSVDEVRGIKTVLQKLIGSQ
jgi:CO dehydrogenase nickel-insertion accessory protein CooC1